MLDKGFGDLSFDFGLVAVGIGSLSDGVPMVVGIHR